MAKSRRKSLTQLAAIVVRAERMVAKLRHDYALGRRAPKTNKKRQKFAKKNGLSEHTVRKLRAFAENYTKDELDALCALRRKGSRLPLHFGYVIYLLTAQSAAERRSKEAMKARRGNGKVDQEKTELAGKKARRVFANKAARQGWTAPQLYAAVVAEYGLKKGHHGRSKVLPQDPRGASQLAISEITKWSEKLKEILSQSSEKDLPNTARSKLNSKLKVVAGEISRIRRLLG